MRRMQFMQASHRLAMTVASPLSMRRLSMPSACPFLQAQQESQLRRGQHAFVVMVTKLEKNLRGCMAMKVYNDKLCRVCSQAPRSTARAGNGSTAKSDKTQIDS